MLHKNEFLLVENMVGLPVEWNHTAMFERVANALDLHLKRSGIEGVIRVYGNTKHSIDSMPRPCVIVTCMVGTGQYQVSMHVGDVSSVTFKTNDVAKVIGRIISGS